MKKACKWAGIGIIQMDKNTKEYYEEQALISKKWNEENPGRHIRMGFTFPNTVNVIVWTCGVHRHKYFQELEWEQVTTDPPQRMAG